jgi:hypothetical protein
MGYVDVGSNLRVFVHFDDMQLDALHLDDWADLSGESVEAEGSPAWVLRAAPIRTEEARAEG